MEKINIELFRNEYEKIEDKLRKISNIPKYQSQGESFDGIDFDEYGVYYKTTTYYSGCGTEYYNLFVSWAELNNSIEYFKEKYAKELQQKEDEKKKTKEQAEAHIKELELKRLAELMEKYKEDIDTLK